MIDEKVLIERLEEKAIKTLGINRSQFAMDKGEYSSYCSLSLNEVKEITKDLSSEHNNGWISVEDELPPRNESVLCWAVSLARGGDCCCLGSCDNGFWFMQTQIDTYSFPQQYEVVAWHKIPAPYKKGE